MEPLAAKLRGPSGHVAHKRECGQSRQSGGIRQCATWTERECARERERERQREGQCVDMNEGSVVKAVLNEVQIREFDESVPVYFVRLGS